MHKKRGYKRETPIKLVRDYTLFAIACEGSVREPEYFKIFRFLSKKIAVDVIEDIVNEEEALSVNTSKSAPKWVLDRALRYVEKEGLSDEDELWFVMDVDRWKTEQLREIAAHCERFPNWHIVLSNPCFEVWLYFHRKDDITKSTSQKCSEFKHEIASFDECGYTPMNFIPYLKEAVVNAKAADKDKKHFMPQINSSKVYELGEAILKVVGKNEFERFIANIQSSPSKKNKKINR